MDVKAVSNKLGRCSFSLAYLGAITLFALMALTTADVVGRYIFNAPILGVFEVTEFMVLIVVFSFIGRTQSLQGHISVDLFVMHLPRRIQASIDLFTHTLCLLLMILITWMGVERAFEMMEAGENSLNLRIPDYPFVFFLVLGCAVMCIEYIRDLIRLYGSRKEDTAS